MSAELEKLAEQGVLEEPAENVHFSSKKMDWNTPQDFYEELDAEFHFDGDACADTSNHKHPYWMGPGSLLEDCLQHDWDGPGDEHQPLTWFMNPPYGRGIVAFVRKAASEALYGRATVVALLPARTDTAWFHGWIWDTERQCPLDGVEVRFLKGRLKFSGHKNSAPFPSMIVIFRDPLEGAR